MQPGDRVHVLAGIAVTTDAEGTILAVRHYGWGQFYTVDVELDDGEQVRCAPSDVRLIEGENA